MNPEPIEGKVARVLDTRELVINRGSEHGVEVGMVFEVLDTTGQDIRDPDTHNVIGSVRRVKLPVKVFLVQPKLAVARTFRTRKRNRGGVGLNIPDLLVGPRWVTEPETFKTRDAAWEAIDEEESFVKAGDPVRQVLLPDEAVDESELPDRELPEAQKPLNPGA